jgi:hypothetical protein
MKPSAFVMFFKYISRSLLVVGFIGNVHLRAERMAQAISV